VLHIGRIPPSGLRTRWYNTPATSRLGAAASVRVRRSVMGIRRAAGRPMHLMNHRRDPGHVTTPTARDRRVIGRSGSGIGFRDGPNVMSPIEYIVSQWAQYAPPDPDTVRDVAIQAVLEDLGRTGVSATRSIAAISTAASRAPRMSSMRWRGIYLGHSPRGPDPTHVEYLGRPDIRPT
jgi:hypothetical protein